MSLMCEPRPARSLERARARAEQPAEDADDPRDLAAIESSKANTGDYKLKSGADYEVPEDQQVNAEKKRRQMMLLEENMHSIKMRFNKRFQALRDLKRQIVESIVDGNARVREIDAEVSKNSLRFYVQFYVHF